MNALPSHDGSVEEYMMTWCNLIPFESSWWWLPLGHASQPRNDLGSRLWTTKMWVFLLKRSWLQSHIPRLIVYWHNKAQPCATSQCDTHTHTHITHTWKALVRLHVTTKGSKCWHPHLLDDLWPSQRPKNRHQSPTRRSHRHSPSRQCLGAPRALQTQSFMGRSTTHRIPAKRRYIIQFSGPDWLTNKSCEI